MASSRVVNAVTVRCYKHSSAEPRRRLLFAGDVTPKTTEQHLIVRIGKFEAEVTNNKRLRPGY